MSRSEARFTVRLITELDADEICTWRYVAPFDVYNGSAEGKADLMRPEYAYHAVDAGEDRCVGFCCYGADARVPSGEYVGDVGGVLDVGLGMRPDWTGRGHGREFAAAIIDQATTDGGRLPERYRVTVALWNERSLAVWRGLGFAEVSCFVHEVAGVFVVLEIPAARLRPGDRE